MDKVPSNKNCKVEKNLTGRIDKLGKQLALS